MIERRLGRRDLLVAALTAGQLGVVLPVLAASTQLFGNVISSERDIEDATRLLPDTPRRLGARARRAAAGGRGRSRRSARSSRSPASPSRATATACASAAGCSSAPTRSCRCGASMPCASSRACCGARSGSRRCASRSRATPRSRPPRARCIPLLPRAEVAAFLAELLPELADEPDGLTAAAGARGPPLRPAAGRRRPGRRRRRLPARPDASPWPLILAPLLALNGWWTFQAAGWRLRDGRLAMRSRMLAAHHASHSRGAAAGARHRAEPVPAPRRARRPRGRGRQGRPRPRPPPRGAGRRRAVGAAAAMSATFYLDLGSPYVYLAAERLDDLGLDRRRVAADLARRPVQAHRAAPRGACRRAASSGWPRSRRARRTTGCRRCAGPTAGRATTCRRTGPAWRRASATCWSPYARTALRMAFTEGRDLSQPAGGARGGAALRARPRVGHGADRCSRTSRTACAPRPRRPTPAASSASHARGRRAPVLGRRPARAALAS